ncbi:MAG: hypothetical protein KDK39_08155 [Leptospiraceae bacterium]|nr:hypothetical protein [Leptospiraceae bacterium]
MKKIIISILLLILIFSAMWTVANWKHIASFPPIVSSFYAKEFCSCYYVTKRSAEACHATVKQYIELSDFQHDEATQTVTASGLGSTNQARYLGENQGCVLVSTP